MSYDDNNIFAKILRSEIPCNKIYEDEFVLSFHDINPQKKIHALVIPNCLLYTSPSPRDRTRSRMPSSA